MDWAFDQVQDSIDSHTADPGLVGILSGLDVTEHAPAADLTVDVATGVAYDAEGQRVYVPDAITVVDCSVDEYGVPTDPPTATFQRYLSVFAAFDRELTDPATDGNGVPIWTHHLESFRVFVRQGAEAGAGTAVPPPLLPDAELLTDILLTSGQTAILNAHLDTDRRQDWLRAWADPGAGYVDEWLVYGQPDEAIEAVWRKWNEHVSDLGWFHGGGVIAYTPGQTWFGAVPLTGPTPPVASVAEALDALLYDLAAAGPPAGDALISATDYTGTYVIWAAGSIATAIATVAGALDAHIGGAAPEHPATAITTAVITGTPEEEAAPSEVQTVLQHVFDHLNDRTERSTGETVDGAWKFENGESQIPHRAQQVHNVVFEDSPWAKTFNGGSTSPWETFENIASGLRQVGSSGWGHMWGGFNSIAVGANVVDMCVVRGATGKTRYLVLIDATNVAGLSFDPNNFADTDFAWDLTTGLPAAPTGPWVPTACCSDGTTVYVMFRDSGGAAAVHYVQAYDPRTGAVKTGWPATGRELPEVGMGHSLAMTDNIRCVSLTTLGMGANLLATLNSWVPCVALGTSDLISIVDADDGGIHDSGSGDCPNSAVQNIWPSGALCSDGSVVYFGVWNETTELGALCTCTIADPDVGSGFASMPKNLGGIGSAFPRDALFDGDLVWVADNFSHASPHTLARLHTYYVASDTWSAQNLPANCMGANGAGVGNIAFDGINLWLEVLLDLDAGGGMNTMALWKIPTTSAHPDGADPVDAEERQLVCYLEAPDEASTMLAADMGRMIFDGDSVWAIRCGKPGAIGAGSMMVRRVPKAGMR